MSLFQLQFAHSEIKALANGRGCEAYSYVYKRMAPTKEHEKQAKFMLKPYPSHFANLISYAFFKSAHAEI